MGKSTLKNIGGEFHDKRVKKRRVPISWGEGAIKKEGRKEKTTYKEWKKKGHRHKVGEWKNLGERKLLGTDNGERQKGRMRD